MTRKIPTITPTARRLNNSLDQVGNVYLASDGNTGALISIGHNADGQLVIEVYRADSDVLVRAPFANLESLTRQAENTGKPDLMDYAAEGGLS